MRERSKEKHIILLAEAENKAKAEEKKPAEKAPKIEHEAGAPSVRLILQFLDEHNVKYRSNQLRPYYVDLYVKAKRKK